LTSDAIYATITYYDTHERLLPKDKCKKGWPPDRGPIWTGSSPSQPLHHTKHVHRRLAKSSHPHPHNPRPHLKLLHQKD